MKNVCIKCRVILSDAETELCPACKTELCEAAPELGELETLSTAELLQRQKNQPRRPIDQAKFEQVIQQQRRLDRLTRQKTEPEAASAENTQPKTKLEERIALLQTMLGPWLTEQLEKYRAELETEFLEREAGLRAEFEQRLAEQDVEIKKLQNQLYLGTPAVPRGQRGRSAEPIMPELRSMEQLRMVSEQAQQTTAKREQQIEEVMRQQREAKRNAEKAQREAIERALQAAAQKNQPKPQPAAQAELERRKAELEQQQKAAKEAQEQAQREALEQAKRENEEKERLMAERAELERQKAELEKQKQDAELAAQRNEARRAELEETAARIQEWQENENARIEAEKHGLAQLNPERGYEILGETPPQANDQPEEPEEPPLPENLSQERAVYVLQKVSEYLEDCNRTAVVSAVKISDLLHKETDRKPLHPYPAAVDFLPDPAPAGDQPMLIEPAAGFWEQIRSELPADAPFTNTAFPDAASAKYYGTLFVLHYALHAENWFRTQRFSGFCLSLNGTQSAAVPPADADRCFLTALTVYYKNRTDLLDAMGILPERHLFFPHQMRQFLAGHPERALLTQYFALLLCGLMLQLYLPAGNAPNRTELAKELKLPEYLRELQNQYFRVQPDVFSLMQALHHTMLTVMDPPQTE